MGDIIQFAFDGDRGVRGVEVEGKAWFAATDVASILSYRNASDMVRNLDDDEKGTHKLRTLGGEQDLLIISESGVYNAIWRSKKEEAKRFRRFFTNEVMPSLRKHGSYGILPRVRTIAPPEDRDEHVDHHFRYRLRQEFARIEAQWAEDAPPGAKPWTIANTLLRSKQAFQRVVGRPDMPDHHDWLMSEAEMRKKHFEQFYQLGIDVDYVFTGRRALAADERDILDVYRRASPADRADARALFERLPNNQVADKLMALDADLKCGFIGKAEYKERRRTLFSL